MEEGGRGEELCSYDTLFTADSVECCPTPEFSLFWLVGCYQLQEHTKQRVGCLWLNKIEKKGAEIKIKQKEIKTRGILDIKWSHHSTSHGEDGTTRPVFATANSDGSVSIRDLYKQHTQEPSGKDEEGETKSLCWTSDILDNKRNSKNEESDICLSLEWSDRVELGDVKIVSSHSNHSLSLWSLSLSSLSLLHSWVAHQHEVWIASFNYHDPNFVFSGSDDCYLKGWDTRTNNNTEIFKKRHDMGVTTIQSHPHQPNYFCSGSYDEVVQLWDLRSMRRPVNQVSVGGGVWRTKWHPTDPSLLLTACMHAGFKILHFPGMGGEETDTDNSAEIKVVCSNDNHESLAYGCDWFYNPHFPFVSSCSFYDHFCTVWNPSLTPS